MSDPQREACLRIIEARTELDRRFKDIRRVGTSGGNGTFSLVMSALDISTGRRVALKFFRPDKLHDSYRWECFGREWKILEQLRGHPDIIGMVATYSHFVENMSSAVVSETIAPAMPARKSTKRRQGAPKPRVDAGSVFLNIPYDDGFENLFLAYISAISAFGFTPRATLEIPFGQRRLDRILTLVRQSQYSIHDLSRVQLDCTSPRTPRFNMSFFTWTKTGGRS